MSRFLAAPSKTIAIFAGFFARGIAAEPPKPTRSGGEGDGADSPTRANEVSEAARPNSLDTLCNFNNFLHYK